MTRKEKFIALLKNWKTYVFGIIPFAMFIAAIAIVYCGEENSINALLGTIMVFVAIVLISVPQIIDLFKRKTKRTTVLAIVLIVVFVALVVALPFVLADYPKLFKMEEECEVLHQEYLQADPADKGLANLKHDAWRNARDDMHEFAHSLNRKLYAIMMAWLVSVAVVSFLDPKGYGPNTDETSPQDNTPPNNTTIN